jgi:MEKHLA domain/Ion transport protein
MSLQTTPLGRVDDINTWIQWSSNSLMQVYNQSLLELMRIDSIEEVHTHKRYAVLSHGTQDDPIFCYSNVAARDAFQYTEDEFYQLPSRYSAPGGGSWSTITKEVMQKYWWAWVPILCFIVVSTFIVVNLIIAVICDAVAAIQTQEMTKHVDEMQHLTSDAMAHNEAHHRQEIARLETKIDQLTTLLSALNFDQARTITSSERKDL